MATVQAATYSMEQIMDKIEQASIMYQQHPLWSHLKQGNHDADAAIKMLQVFTPAISHFILGFKDLNEFIIPYESPQNQLEKAINGHAEEDASHYRLYLEDWQKLGGDALLQPYVHMVPSLIGQDHHTLTGTIATDGTSMDATTKAFSFLWADECNRHNRKLLYQYAKLVSTLGRDPVARFAIVESGEETGLVMFRTTAKLVKTIMNQQPDKELRYFGDYHLALETGGLIESPETAAAANTTEPQGESVLKCACEADDLFKQLALSKDQFDLCSRLVTDTFQIFTEWLDGILRVMQHVK